MNVIDTSIIFFLLSHYYVSGCILHSFLYGKLDQDNIKLIPVLLIFGIFVNISFLQIWHLFYPVNQFCAFSIHLAELFFITNKQKSFKYFYLLKNISITTWCIFIFFLIWVSILTNNSLGPYDSGLYHLPIINWNHEYKIVKGLANLSIDYGINSNLFLLFSLTKNYPFTINFIWDHNAVFLCVGFFSFFCIPMEYLRGIDREKYKYDIITRLIFTIPLIHYAFYFFPGTSTDLPVFIIGCLLSIECFELFYKKSHNNAIIPVLIFLGITIKISFLFFGISGLLISLYQAIRNQNKVATLMKKGMILLIIFSSIIWCCRGILLSGYPFHPITVINAPVNWKVDRQEIDNASKAVTYFRMPYDQDQSLKQQLPRRIEAYKHSLFTQHRRVEFFYPLIIGLLGVLYMGFYGGSPQLKKFMIIFLPAIIQFGIWIYIPRNRYSAFAAWWFCSNGGFYLIGSIIKSNSLKLLPLLLLLLGLSFHTIDYLGQEKKFFPEYKQKVIPVPNLKTFKTKAGLEIFTPVSGQNQCWDSNIPCTPYHNENLKQFDENNLGSGFYLNHVD